MGANLPDLNTPEWYSHMAKSIEAATFLCLRDAAYGTNGDCCHMEWSPGDMTQYKLVLTRYRDELAIALLNCEQRAGVVPFRAEDLHAGYIAGNLKISNDCTAWAVTAIVNAATYACLGRPSMAV